MNDWLQEGPFLRGVESALRAERERAMHALQAEGMAPTQVEFLMRVAETMHAEQLRDLQRLLLEPGLGAVH